MRDSGLWWVLVLIAAAAAGVYALSCYAEKKQNEWIAACVADGNKRYVCEERYATAHPPAPQTNVTVIGNHQ